MRASPHTWRSTNPSGLGNSSGCMWKYSNDTFIDAGQTLAAVSVLSVCFIGCPSALPTHTTMARLGV
jgi:hypothetical protein